MAYRESKLHGTHGFPFVVYPALIPERLQSVALHWHEEMEIIYVTRGTIRVYLGITEYVLGVGDIVLVHPQTIHSIQQYDDVHAKYYNIIFRLSMLESGADDVCTEKYLEPIYSRKLLMPEYLPKGDPLQAELEPLILSLLDDPRRQRVQDELLIKARVFEIMHCISRRCEAADKTSASEDVVYEKLKRSLRFLEENYAENLSLTEMAAVSNYSQSHFSKLFRQLTGQSFTQYLKDYRLDMAAERLRSEPTKISEIAIACGFPNLSYFSRSFYEKFRETPTAYRRFTERRGAQPHDAP